jgi:hypothetical protein
MNKKLYTKSSYICDSITIRVDDDNIKKLLEKD